MRQKEYSARMEWARNLKAPACIVCTLPFKDYEPAISMSSSGFNAYFHARCYDIVVESSRKARNIFDEMILGLRSWSSGVTEIERIAPFRDYVPGRLKFPKTVPDGLDSRRDGA